MKRNISADEACSILFNQPVTIRSENVKLADAYGRVLFEDVKARIPYPPFDRSPYDGYAFRGEDTATATQDNQAVLQIVEEIPAGTYPQHEITTGYAAKILTGGPIPKGANATIKYEITKFTDTEVHIFNPVPPNTDIVYAGTDIMPEAILAQKGTTIIAPIITTLANQGIDNVNVFAKPVINIISTGSELCEVGETLRPAAIYNSNVHTLSAYLTGVGAQPVNGGCVQDDPEAIAEKIAKALDMSDMVITTGGASVGDYDWALKSAEILGADVLFWKVEMRPGGAVVAAVKDNKLYLGLSGNPAAAILGLFRLAMPYIKKLCGRAECFYKQIDVALLNPMKKQNPKTRLLRGRLEIIDSKAYFVESGGQRSEDIASFNDCDLLGEISMGSPPLPAGAIIKAYRL